jgi:hypothetical protein
MSGWMKIFSYTIPMSDITDIDYKVTSFGFGSNKEPVHECPMPHIYWYTHIDPDAIHHTSTQLHTVKMDDGAKDWSNSKKREFVNNKLIPVMNNPLYENRQFKIMFNDCNGYDKSWYTVNSTLNDIRSNIGFGGKSKNRRHRRRKTQNRRHKTQNRRHKTQNRRHK